MPTLEQRRRAAAAMTIILMKLLLLLNHWRRRSLPRAPYLNYNEARSNVFKESAAPLDEKYSFVRKLTPSSAMGYKFNDEEGDNKMINCTTTVESEKVNGLRNFEGGEANSEQSLAGPSHPSIDDQGMDPNEVESPAAESGYNIQKKGRKRGRSEVEDARIFYKGMVDAAKGLVEAAKEVAMALRPPKCDKISEELEKLHGLTDEDMLDVMDLLGTDPQLAEVFFGIKDNLKYTWLRRKLDRI